MYVPCHHLTAIRVPDDFNIKKFEIENNCRVSIVPARFNMHGDPCDEGKIAIVGENEQVIRRAYDRIFQLVAEDIPGKGITEPLGGDWLDRAAEGLAGVAGG